MEQAHDPTVTFRRRVLGFDRREVEQALTARADDLRRIQAERDDLRASASNVERIGAEVAEMLRALADRAIEVETEAATGAARLLEEARIEADGLRTQAAAALAEAQARAAALLDESAQRRAAVAQRRESAVVALQVAMSQIAQLTSSIEGLDDDLGGTIDPWASVEPSVTQGEDPEVDVSLEPPTDDAAEEVAEDAPAVVDVDAIPDAIARLKQWTSAN